MIITESDSLMMWLLIKHGMEMRNFTLSPRSTLTEIPLFPGERESLPSISYLYTYASSGSKAVYAISSSSNSFSNPMIPSMSQIEAKGDV
ncbi:hypothetical protein AVEN_126713-1 [Araneus ventricosus]|uniref:Uncharacterized protein n=1 Tax=Araneus ventricosus TaxID=182803 RepID=A0A4Y2DKY9_ARAVE|nr:hypothetical protein AVEN_6923-1 [Araneus ventricosus]GBM17416.1 hypothetical protein AVEN_189619-1 [Araneus ventricosus]GBM17512.1 hypothetical protein AVEN_43799-1 [Araneus ventricosus]GBM17540.1 hypothetical protein AVEN_126713-1 [Araneus ventricosus]